MGGNPHSGRRCIPEFCLAQPYLKSVFLKTDSFLICNNVHYKLLSDLLALIKNLELLIYGSDMYAVIFEVIPTADGKDEYLKIAAQLRELLVDMDGFISIERFQSLVEDNKILSLSFWRDEESIAKWRNLLDHRSAQKAGRNALFESYRIRVAEVVRDYSDSKRAEAPNDSKQIHF